MSASGRLVDYLGKGLASARPASLTLTTGAVGLYYATDTGVLSAWTGSAWSNITGSSSVGYLNGINDQTGTAYTLVASDAGKDIRCTNAAAIALNIATQATSGITVGFWALVSQGGAGSVTITGLSGVTLRTPNGAATSAQYDARGIEYLGSDEWRVW